MLRMAQRERRRGRSVIDSRPRVRHPSPGPGKSIASSSAAPVRLSRSTSADARRPASLARMPFHSGPRRSRLHRGDHEPERRLEHPRLAIGRVLTSMSSLWGWVATPLLRGQHATTRDRGIRRRRRVSALMATRRGRRKRSPSTPPPLGTRPDVVLHSPDHHWGSRSCSVVRVHASDSRAQRPTRVCASHLRD